MDATEKAKLEHALREVSEKIQDDLLTLLDGLPQLAQVRACQIVVDNLKKIKTQLNIQ